MSGSPKYWFTSANPPIFLRVSSTQRNLNNCMDVPLSKSDTRSLLHCPVVIINNSNTAQVSAAKEETLQPECRVICNLPWAAVTTTDKASGSVNRTRYDHTGPTTATHLRGECLRQWRKGWSILTHPAIERWTAITCSVNCQSSTAGIRHRDPPVNI